MSLLREDDPRFRYPLQLMDDAEYTEALRQLDALLPELSGEDRLVALYWKSWCLATPSVSDSRQARTCLDEALNQVDTSSQLKIYLELQDAFLLEAEQGVEKAIAEIRSILDRYSQDLKTPELLWAYLRAKTDLGEFLAIAGHYSEAVKELEDALFFEDRPASRYYLEYYLGHAYYMLGNDAGDLDKAKDHFESALREEQSSPAAGIYPSYAAMLQYDLAAIAFRQWRLQAARGHVEAALTIPLADEELTQRLKRLKTRVGEAEARAASMYRKIKISQLRSYKKSIESRANSSLGIPSVPAAVL